MNRVVESPESGSLSGGCYFVRYGTMGHLGRFTAPAGAAYDWGTQVVIRSRRGLECGQVLAPAAAVSAKEETPQGEILRRMSVEDHLLLARAGQKRHQALRRCEQLLLRHGLPDVLIDAEYLLDGSTVVFYFLGPPSPELESLLDHLAREFESQVRLQDFLQAAQQGCGPDCGSDKATGCHSCAESCALAQMCHAKAASAPKAPGDATERNSRPSGCR